MWPRVFFSAEGPGCTSEGKSVTFPFLNITEGREQSEKFRFASVNSYCFIQMGPISVKHIQFIFGNLVFRTLL